jgi:hypothetical protein
MSESLDNILKSLIQIQQVSNNDHQSISISKGIQYSNLVSADQQF